MMCVGRHSHRNPDGQLPRLHHQARHNPRPHVGPKKPDRLFVRQGDTPGLFWGLTPRAPGGHAAHVQDIEQHKPALVEPRIAAGRIDWRGDREGGDPRYQET